MKMSSRAFGGESSFSSESSFFLIGPQLTLPIYIYTQIKFGVTPEVNAIATLILVGTITVLALGALIATGGRRLRRRPREGAV